MGFRKTSIDKDPIVILENSSKTALNGVKTIAARKGKSIEGGDKLSSSLKS
jgi:hypothetical protein